MQKVAVCVLIVVLAFPFKANATLDLVQDPSTQFRVSPLLQPLVQKNILDDGSLIESKVGAVAGFGVEVPIVNWFSSGFLLQFTLGLPGLVPVVDLGGIAKFQWPFAIFSTGNVAPYIMIPLGFSYTTAPVANVLGPQVGTAESEKTTLFSDGLGINGSLGIGLEFFPFRNLGFFAEGGYRANLIWHHITKGPDNTRTWQFASYWIRGFTASVGTKIAF